MTNGKPHTPGCFRERRPHRPSTEEQQPGPERKAPSPGSKCSFQTSLPLVGMSRRLLGAPPLTLGSCQESSRPRRLPLQPPSRHVPPLSAHCPGLPMRLFSVPQLASMHSPLLLRLPWQLWPPPVHSPSWFPRKGRGGNIASRPSEVGALGEFFSLPNQSPSLCIYFSHPTPGTHTSQAHTSGSPLHLGLPRWGDPIS